MTTKLFVESFENFNLYPVRTVAQEGHQGQPDVERRYYLGDVVAISKSFDYEWWQVQVYVPRQTMLLGLHTARAIGISVDTPFGCLPAWIPIRASHYGGPGRPYANEPSCRRIGRWGHVFTQCGGWDI